MKNLKDEEKQGDVVNATDIFETVRAKYSIRPGGTIRLEGLKEEYKGKEFTLEDFSLEGEKLVKLTERDGVYVIAFNTSKATLEDMAANLKVNIK